MKKHPSLFTLSDFEFADFETQKEVYLYWKDYGHPYALEFWMERLILAIEIGKPTGGGILSFDGGDKLKQFAKKMLNEVAPV